MANSLKQRFVRAGRRWMLKGLSHLLERDVYRDLRRADKFDEMEQKLRMLTTALDIPSLNERSYPFPPVKNGWRYDEIFILGSGASLNLLSTGEKEFLNRQPTIAMNKYLIYWRVLGLWPRYTFLADTHYPAPEVLLRTIEALKDPPGNQLPRFILTDEYRTWPVGPLQPIYFKRHEGIEKYPWADSINEKMFFHRGSLTCLLNLITVLRFAPRVTLLGVDLGDGKAFYQEQYDLDKSLHDHWEGFRKSSGAHPTAITLHGIPPIQTVLPWVFQKMKTEGIEVVAYNPDSLLVKDKLCPLRERFT